MINSPAHTMNAADEARMVDMDHGAATNYYAGPFCGCGDYSCPASDRPEARCVNSEFVDYADFDFEYDESDTEG